MGVATAVAAGIAVGSAVVGEMKAGQQRDAAARAAKEAQDIINSVGAPPDLSKRILLDKFKEAGVLTPELEQKIDAGYSKVSQIQEKPELKDAQMQALQTLGQRSRTGLGPEDRAALNQVRSEIQRDQEAKRQQIIQQAQARGMSGSGAELISQLTGNQASANTAAMQGEQLAGNASARALEALKAYGGMAGQVRGQDFDIERAKADAADQFKRFDTQNQVEQQARNVAARNQAQAANLANKQRIQDTNTIQENAESLRANAAKRDYFNDTMAKATGQANMKQSEAALASQQAAQVAQNYQNIGSGAAGAISGLGNLKGSTPSTTASTTSDVGTSPQPGTAAYDAKMKKIYGG